jgi:hypothetical protein
MSELWHKMTGATCSYKLVPNFVDVWRIIIYVILGHVSGPVTRLKGIPLCNTESTESKILQIDNLSRYFDKVF